MSITQKQYPPGHYPFRSNSSISVQETETRFPKMSGSAAKVPPSGFMLPCLHRLVPGGGQPADSTLASMTPLPLDVTGVQRSRRSDPSFKALIPNHIQQRGEPQGPAPPPRSPVGVGSPPRDKLTIHEWVNSLPSSRSAIAGNKYINEAPTISQPAIEISKNIVLAVD